MSKAPRRILLVSGYFPPLSPIGAVRAGKLAEHWVKAGHDVRTIAIALPQSELTADSQISRSTYYLPYTAPGEGITRLKASVVNSPLGRLFHRPGQSPGASAGAKRSPSNESAKIAKMGWLDIYRQFVQFPDRYKT